MKKSLYYIIWFIAELALLSIIELLNVADFGSDYTTIVILILSCVIAGAFSPTHRKFDYLIAIIMPLSLFIMLFVIGFLMKDDLEESRFHLYIALDFALHSPLLSIYCIMALSTFIASFKSIRIREIIKNRHKTIVESH